jgi:hypothetical protein
VGTTVGLLVRLPDGDMTGPMVGLAIVAFSVGRDVEANEGTLVGRMVGLSAGGRAGGSVVGVCGGNGTKSSGLKGLEASSLGVWEGIVPSPAGELSSFRRLLEVRISLCPTTESRSLLRLLSVLLPVDLDLFDALLFLVALSPVRAG